MHQYQLTLQINISRFLWTLGVILSIDVTGAKNLPDTWNHTNGFNCRPVRFDCTIALRIDTFTELLTWSTREQRA